MSTDKQYVYVIECENNIFYVDNYSSDKILQSNEIEQIKINIIENKQHLNYKPIKINNFNFNNNSQNKIKNTIKDLMLLHGIKNVRCSDYNDLELSEKIINKLNFELLGRYLGAYDRYCFHCLKCHYDNYIDCLGKNIDTSTFLKDCNDYNTILVKINYITNIYDKICLLKKQIDDIYKVVYEDTAQTNVLVIIYQKYIMNNNDPDNMAELKDNIIKKNELESLLFDKKLELINIYKVHKSEYYLKDILTELYKRKFIHMEKLI
jgi:hypothetical protein